MIPLFAVHMPDAVDEPLLKVLHSGYIGQGAKVEEFEAHLAAYLGNPNVLTLNSGTSALELALHLAGVGPGTEVISTPMTCTATNTPILSRGGKIVWADVDPNTGLIDFADVRRKLTSHTAAVMAVDWGGTSCDYATPDVLGQYAYPVIRDAAHAFGAPVPAGPRFHCYSFQAIKHITTVDGGALVTASDTDYKRGKLLRWYGIDREGSRKDMRCEEDILEAGWKWHMNDVAATIGLVQLDYIDRIVNQHRDNAHFYDESLAPFFKSAVPEAKRSDSAYWLYTILLPAGRTDAFIDYMLHEGVQVSRVHAAHHTHTAFRESYQPLPGVEEFASRQCSIPVHWKLTRFERERIVTLANRFARGKV